MNPSTFLQYNAPWPVYAMDWYKSWAPCQITPKAAFRLAIASYKEDSLNKLSIIGLQDERALVDDGSHEGYPDFVVLAEAEHEYPATKLQWQPPSAATFSWNTHMKSTTAELLATTSDALRIWDLSYTGEQNVSNFIGRHQATLTSGYRLGKRLSLSGSRAPAGGRVAVAPLTSFSWNPISPNLIVTSSVDTTCTVWDINKSTAITQLIAHDREVYDVAWLPGSTQVFTSVGADGSLRLFDLRALEHSTILYEASTVRAKENSKCLGEVQVLTRQTSSPLLRIAFNPADSNYVSIFHADSGDVVIIDMRNPGVPVAELKAHRAPVNAIGWGKQESVLATVADDSQLLVWDLSANMITPLPPLIPGTQIPASPRLDIKPHIMSDPILAYTADREINNLAWSPPLPQMSVPGTTFGIPGGEWMALAVGNTVKMLKV